LYLYGTEWSECGYGLWSCHTASGNSLIGHLLKGLGHQMNIFFEGL
jgi:hypothetical protein